MFADLFDVICGPDNGYHSVFEHVFVVFGCDFVQSVNKSLFLLMNIYIFAHNLIY